MSKSYYETGAIHHDHHKELHVDTVNGGDVGKLISAFFMEDVEDAEIVKGVTEELPVVNNQEKCGKPTFFIHPSVDANQEWQIHKELERLVARQGIQEICKYLSLLSEDKKVLLPQNAEKAYNELVRLGMPDGEGYSLKTFMKHYKR